jgi:hypothetical protein
VYLLSHELWQTSYRHEDGDLIELFYVPALRCAMAYDRMTGYFSADALALAARGIQHLIRNGGRMRLLVGCTLDRDEIAAIEQGYDLRQKVLEKLAARRWSHRTRWRATAWRRSPGWWPTTCWT